MENFIVDHHTWAIKYIKVDTRNCWLGKKVLVSPRWIERVSWTDFKISVVEFAEAYAIMPCPRRTVLWRGWKRKLLQDLKRVTKEPLRDNGSCGGVRAGTIAGAV